MRAKVAVIIPVYNEEASIALVIEEIPRDLVDEIFVVDNASTDRSAELARCAGARVVAAPERGYGSACLAGIEAASGYDVLVFLDGDHSDYPEDLSELLKPILTGDQDLVIGSRMLDRDSRRALLPQSRFGNWLATRLMRLLFGIQCSDLGPFRAITRESLHRLAMRDRTFGWTVEMQLRAKLAGLRVLEVPVRYRARIGKSKISGTVRGAVLAGYKILKTIFFYRLFPPRFSA